MERTTFDTKGCLSLDHDAVNHPRHYTGHPSGVECIQITEHMGFCLGNALKYIWRADLKNDAIEDLEKAKWYLEREIQNRKLAQVNHLEVKNSAIGQAIAEVDPGLKKTIASIKKQKFRTEYKGEFK